MDHGPRTPPQVGVLIAQLGTPEAPTEEALRPYLREFLSDPRVVDLPRWKWLPVLHLIVLRRRPARSAALYRRIWTPAGSPLMVHSRAQVHGVQERLGGRYRVELGMRYGRPSIGSAVEALVAGGIDRILVFPMFPQFSCSTTASVYDAAHRAAAGRRRVPALRHVPPYYDDPHYVGALAARLRDTACAAAQPPERYLFTFHGVPRRYISEGDPYREQCLTTAELLAAALSLPADRWLCAFQSHFGKEEWLQPYTDVTLAELGRRQVGSLLVACPGFTADCLETVDEIGREGAAAFTTAGGGRMLLCPCLNDHPAWLDAMAAIVRRQTAGWVD
ncbi:MAG: ferrochelatase [Candidatus Latescibacterota bacterium]